MVGPGKRSIILDPIGSKTTMADNGSYILEVGG